MKQQLAQNATSNTTPVAIIGMNSNVQSLSPTVEHKKQPPRNAASEIRSTRRSQYSTIMHREQLKGRSARWKWQRRQQHPQQANTRNGIFVPLRTTWCAPTSTVVIAQGRATGRYATHISRLPLLLPLFASIFRGRKQASIASRTFVCDVTTRPSTGTPQHAQSSITASRNAHRMSGGAASVSRATPSPREALAVIPSQPAGTTHECIRTSRGQSSHTVHLQ